ncbi:MAG: RNA polymerase sigma-70 factor [Paludibacteraceae bacterium]|nr:RNA polymerase sigma-70 factor [Paludibacteraceae bacterium]
MEIKEHNDMIKLIVGGDSSAFKELYRLYYVSLCRFAYKYVGDVAQSEDIVQDTLLKIWEQRGKLSGLTSLKSYLFSAVKNSCLNFLEHQKVVNKYTENVSVEINLLSLQYEDTAFDEDKFFLENQLLAAIDDLPKQCGEIFKMKYLEGLRTKEIATQTNLSPRTVEAHVFNALKTLREKFKNIAPVLILGIICFFTKNS